MEILDREILRRLQINAALSVGDLADKVGISKSACWRRVQKLEKEGVIKERVTLLDAKSIGLSLTSMHNERWAGQFKDAVMAIPGILEAYRMGGEADYLLKAIVKDMPDYDRLYKELIKVGLLDVTAGFVMEEIKCTTALPL